MKTVTSFNRLLAVFLAFIALLIFARIVYSGNIRYISMSWNIFLAWIPFVLSCYFEAYRKKEKWKQAFLFASWLLFFPNALYIVTDLIHLEASTNVPLWYDAVLLFANTLAEAERLAPAGIASIKMDGLLWIAYPQGTAKVKTDVNRDRLWEAIKPMGWLAVRQVALDDTWSAMRFRPAELVGK